MRLLANITALKIRATYSPQGDLSTLFNKNNSNSNSNSNC